MRWREELDRLPVAVVDERSSKSAVLECNGLARQKGVTPALPSAQALARCANLNLLPRSEAEEQALQAILLEFAFTLSPEVEATAPGCCTIDLQRDKGMRWEQACPAIAGQLKSLRVTVRIGIAPNPDLAFIAARRASPVLVVRSPQMFLSQLAVAEIDPPPDLLAVLQDWGIHTLGELTNLPQGEFADRLGADAARLWQCAAGKTTRLLRLTRPVAEFSEAFDFDGEVDSIEPLYFVLRRFLGQLRVRLESAQRVAARLDLALPLENGSCHERSFSIPSPTNDEEILFRILSTHLDGLQLDHRISGMRLRVEPVLPGRQQFRLFDNPLRDPNQFGETLARIIAVVGPGHVGVPRMVDTHRPDTFELHSPAFHTMLGDNSDESRGSIAIGLPLRRYRPPIRAEVNIARNQPAQVFSEKAHGDVLSVLGPYRISGDWWDKRNWEMEEWDVEIAGCGLFRISRKNNQWFVEGCYETTLR